MGRHVICVRIKNKEVWDNFLSFIYGAEGKIKGVVGEHLEEALKMYLMKYNAKLSKKDEKMNDLCVALERMFNACEISKRKVKIDVVYNTIRRFLCVVDKRVVKQHYDYLVAQNVIKECYVIKNKAELEEYVLEQRRRAVEALINTEEKKLKEDFYEKEAEEDKIKDERREKALLEFLRKKQE